jgi:hypothetical protein
VQEEEVPQGESDIDDLSLKDIDAGASLTSGEPSRKTKERWANPTKFLNFPLKLMHQI